MKKTTFLGTAAMLLIFGVTAVGAQSLKIREQMAAEETALKKKAEHTNSACDTTIAVQFNWKDAPEAKLTEYSASEYCDEALYAVRRTCETPLGKDTVKQKIKSITCGFGADRAVTLKDGSVDYKIMLPSSNNGDYVYEFLQNNL